MTRKHDDRQEVAYEACGLRGPHAEGGETAVACWLQTKSVVRWESRGESVRGLGLDD